MILEKITETVEDLKITSEHQLDLEEKDMIKEKPKKLTSKKDSIRSLQMQL